jgi:hypothetical protein
MTYNSMKTTMRAMMVAVQNDGIRYGKACPRPPIAVITPEANPRFQGKLRPDSLPSPRLSLAVVDLPQIENLPLYDLASSTAFALHNIPVEMFFAVLQPSIASQIHDAGF